MEEFFPLPPHPKSSGFVSLTLQLFNLSLLKKKENKKPRQFMSEHPLAFIGSAAF